jgi:hypothetical protein
LLADDVNLLLLLLLPHRVLLCVTDNLRSVGTLLSVSWNPKLVSLQVRATASAMPQSI